MATSSEAGPPNSLDHIMDTHPTHSDTVGEDDISHALNHPPEDVWSQKNLLSLGMFLLFERYLALHCPS